MFVVFCPQFGGVLQHSEDRSYRSKSLPAMNEIGGVGEGTPIVFSFASRVKAINLLVGLCVAGSVVFVEFVYIH